jgi:uncharacterized membrane protein
LMLATFATLILLVQHISTMLQAPNIAAAAGAELRKVVSEEIPHATTSGGVLAGGISTHPGLQDNPDIAPGTDGYPVRINSSGYIQYIDPDIIITLASENDLVIRLLHKPGHFVWPGAVVALAWPADRVNEHLERRIRQTFEIGNGRTPVQDVKYAVNQLTEMAVRAMSPAINDPFTAMTCLDHMGDGLLKFARQGIKPSRFYDLKGRLRLVLEPVTFDDLLSAAFDMLRHASCDNASVLLHMLEVIDMIGQETKSPEVRQLLHRHVRLIQAESQVGELIEQDRQLIQVRGEALLINLKGAPSAPTIIK